MVFLIQSTQNRDTKALQVKLDEVLRALQEARTEFIGVEDDSESGMDGKKQQLQREKR